MKFEFPLQQPESIEESASSEQREKREYNIYMDIQNILITRTIQSNEDLATHMMDWATGPDAVTYAAAFEGLKAENPNLLDDYEKDCEEVIAAIEARMNYLSKPLKKAA